MLRRYVGVRGLRHCGMIAPWIRFPARMIMPRQHALGGVMLEPAYMEHLLRAVFAALVGSKYAAAEAAGQNAGGLIERCQAPLPPRPVHASGDLLQHPPRGRHHLC
jgi:hypothetical protein